MSRGELSVVSRLTYDLWLLVGARRMPRARRGVVSPADAAAARKRLLDAQLGEAKAAKAAKSSKAKSQTPVAALPKSERVDPPGSPATSTSAPGNKKVELKPIAPPVRPEPKAAPEEECKACQGAHRAHTVRRPLSAMRMKCPCATLAKLPATVRVVPPLTRCSHALQCGKSRATPTPRRQKTQATPSSANHSKPTRKRRATTKVAKQPKTADEKPNSKVSLVLLCRLRSWYPSWLSTRILKQGGTVCAVRPGAWICVDRR